MSDLIFDPDTLTGSLIRASEWPPLSPVTPLKEWMNLGVPSPDVSLELMTDGTIVALQIHPHIHFIDTMQDLKARFLRQIMTTWQRFELPLFRRHNRHSGTCGSRDRPSSSSSSSSSPPSGAILSFKCLPYLFVTTSKSHRGSVYFGAPPWDRCH